MGRKTIRWNKIKDNKGKLPGQVSCDKCNCIGMIQEYDYIVDKVAYFYCDCYYGDQARKNENKRWNK